MKKIYIAPAFEIEKFHVESVMLDPSYYEALAEYKNNIHDIQYGGEAITFGTDKNLLQAISYNQFKK